MPLEISSYGVLGAHIALESGSEVLSAITLGVMTATFGGLVRDIISRETPLILKQEVYATGALLSATCYVGFREVGGTDAVSAMAGIISGFAL